MTQDQLSTARTNGHINAEQPQTEVVEKAQRRKFSAAYKLSIVAEADRCDEHGAIGALLRREGLYSSQLSKWRRQRDAGKLTKRASTRGRKQDKQAATIAELQRENGRLQKQLEQAELIIAAQKKLAQALEQTLSGGRETSS